jgi:ribosomal-protein-alanine N-acetyltransferase
MDLHFETERLLIRPIEISDAEFMLQLLNTEGWLKFIGDRNVHSIEEAAAYIQKFITNPNFHYHTIYLKSSNIPIGVLSFLKRDEYEFPDLGFALLPNFERSGFAYEAASAYLNHFKSSSEIKQIIGITKENNIKSIQLLEKLGFSFNNKSQKEALTIFMLNLS